MKPQIPWLRVFVEGVVIVGSILLAFGLQAWWEGREETKSERDYLARIVADLVETRENIVGRSEHYRMLLGHGEAVLPVLTGGRPLPPDTLGFLASVLQATRMVEPVVARSAYDDLISTGNLRVIRNDGLRGALSEFYGGIEYQLRPFDYQVDKIPYREAVRGLVPANVQVVIRTSCLEDAPLEYKNGPQIPGLGIVARDLVAEPELERKLNLALQALAIRPGSTLRIGAVAAGFGFVIDNIDSLLALVETELDS